MTLSCRALGLWLPLLACAALGDVAWAGVQAPPQTPALSTRAVRACETGERWGYGRAIPARVRVIFTAALKGELPDVAAYGEAMAIAREAKDPELKALAKYWQGRVLFGRKLHHLAGMVFDELVAAPGPEATIRIRAAALDCLNRVYRVHPRLLPSSALEHQLSQFVNLKGLARQSAYEMALHVFLRKLAEDTPEADRVEVLHVLNGSGSWIDLAQGLQAASRMQIETAIKLLDRFFATPIPSPMKRYLDPARLTLGRMFSQKNDYKRSLGPLLRVNRTSNHLIRTITETAWAYLMIESYGDAVGTSMSLIRGEMRNTYAPDGAMVLAIAFNELCQYPSALKVVDFLRGKYQPIYDWLKANALLNKPTYPVLLGHVEGKETGVPPPVLSEWIRSPVFITHQDELNRMAELDGDLRKFFRDYLQHLKELGTEVRERLKKTPDIPEVKELKVRYDRLRNAFPDLKKRVIGFAVQLRPLREILIQRINRDLKERNERMIRELQTLAENLYLIRIEIYDGASQDLVWKKAHPGYETFVDKSKGRGNPSGRTVNWGRSTREVWQDELGTLKAQVQDNCSSKDKYMEVQAESENSE